QVEHLLILFASDTILLQCDGNRVEQLLIAEGFGEKFDCPGLHRTNAHGNVPITGNKDYGYAHVFRRKLTLEIQAAQPAQPDIQHKAAWGVDRLPSQERIR